MLCFVRFPIAREGAGDAASRLDGEIEKARAKIAGLLGFAGLFLKFCSVCLVSEEHDRHILRQDDDEIVYRSLHCGRRNPRPALLG